MKRLATLTLAFGIFAGALVLAQASRSIEAQFKAAQHAEEVEGDLRKAIEQYRQIVQTGDRAAAARALIRMAECHQKLDDGQAQNVYQRIVREYADQPPFAIEARNRLTQLTARPKAEDTQIVVRQVWSGDETNVEGMPSADGKLLTFVDWHSTNTGNVAVRDLATGANRLLTNAKLEDGYAYEPVLSPDAKQVAYLWFGGGASSIRIIAIEGGQPRVVVPLNRRTAYHVRWSPDGRRLATTLVDSGQRTAQIGLIDVATGSITALKSTNWLHPTLGGFSPDGRFLTYAISKITSNSENGIYSIAVDGTRESVLVRGIVDETTPAWAPDGRSVVFVGNQSGTLDLCSVRVTDGKPEGDPMIIRRNVGPIVNMGFTRDGSYFYGTRNPITDAYLVDIDPETLEASEKPRRITDHALGSNKSPALSPDGRHIALVRGTRLAATIVVRSVADGTERTLPLKLADGYAVGAFGVTWSSDSRSLFVPEADYTKRTVTIHQINVETGQTQPFLQDAFDRLNPDAVISPDGLTVFFTRRESTEGEYALLRLIRKDTVSGAEVELYKSLSPGVSFFGLAISPDGGQLSFMVNVDDKGNRNLMTVPASGGTPRIVFRGDYSHPAPQGAVWTRDGKHVLAIAAEDKFRQIWAFPVEGGEPRKMNIVFQSIAGLDLSLDGRLLAFTGIQRAEEVWTIKNLLRR